MESDSNDQISWLLRERDSEDDLVEWASFLAPFSLSKYKNSLFKTEQYVSFS